MVDTAIKKILGTVGTIPGQGGLLEQFDKRLRKLQRGVMFELFENISKEEVERLPVVLYKTLPIAGNQRPALFRLYLPTWRGYDEVFWQALGDYAILTLHRVKDLEYNAAKGKIKIEYFVKTIWKGKKPGRNSWNYPEDRLPGGQRDPADGLYAFSKHG